MRPSFYELTKGEDDSVTLDFLPHPPDYIRAYIVAAALDEIGFTTEANLCRKLADQAAGTPTPKYITWHDYEGKSKTVVKIPVEDLKQVAPVVAHALIRTPLRALGGKCIFEYINWDARRQAKVDILAANLMTGSAEGAAERRRLLRHLCRSGGYPRFVGFGQIGLARRVGDQAHRTERLQDDRYDSGASGCTSGRTRYRSARV